MRKKNNKLVSIIIIIVIAVLGYFGYEVDLTDNPAAFSPGTASDKLLEVAVLDVGQGDSIFITLPNGKNMLIDAGLNDSFEMIKGFIEDKGISKIDTVIATHPHADHIGSMDDIINYFDIGEIYMPKVSTNTKSYENMLTAIKNKNLKIKTAKKGVNINLDETVSIEMLSPASNSYEDLNDYSAVVKLTYGNTAFLLTGDAEKGAEAEMVAGGLDLSADVLKAGHHGSRTSSSQDFLDAVSPKAVVISSGKGNDYGHPHEEVMERLTKLNTAVYRTDEEGHIIFLSDGKDFRKE